MDNSISVTFSLAMFLELFSSVIPILNSPSSPCTPGCRRCISSLLAELAEHALLRIIAVHPRIFLLPLLLVAEPGFVEFLFCTLEHTDLATDASVVMEVKASLVDVVGTTSSSS